MADSDMHHQLLLMGVDHDEYKWVLDEFVEFVKQEGFDVDKQFIYPKPDARDVKAALEDEDMNRKIASWVRHVPNKTLIEVLRHPDRAGDEVWGFSVTTPASQEELEEVVDHLPAMETVEAAILPADRPHPDKPPDMKYHDRGRTNANAPFSYDPQQDYYWDN